MLRTLPFKSFMISLLIGLTMGMPFLSGCTGKGKDTVYPPPENLALAPVQRQEFVDAFLQGRWCQAESLMKQSLENYLRQDDFCRAAYNFYLMYKIKSYIAIDAPHELQEAERLASLSGNCISVPSSENPNPATPKDTQYSKLLNLDRLQELRALLQKDKDPLYASVYSRKIALRAQALKQTDMATQALEFARQIDSRQGWVVFLIEDWKMQAGLSTNPGTRAKIKNRIEILEKLIHPCAH